MRESLRLFVLGRLQTGEGLTVVAEFEGYRGVHRCKLDEAALTDLVADIGRLRVFVEAGAPQFCNQDLTELGVKLFELIVAGQVQRIFDRAAINSRSAGNLMPLELVVEDHTLAGWPWEYLFDRAANSFLCKEFHPIVRGIFTIVQPRALTSLNGTIQVLILLGVQDSDQYAKAEEQVRWIQNVFKAELANDAVEVFVFQGKTYVELESVIASRQFHVVHFFGHARFDDVAQEAYLRFDVSAGEPFKLTARAFASMVTQYQRDLRLVFLNACETGRTSPETDPSRSAIAAALLDLGVPAVVATQFSMPDSSAHYLAATIYNALAVGKTLIDALSAGRRAMQMVKDAKFFDWGIPVLYSSLPWIQIFPEPSSTAGLRAFSEGLDHNAGLMHAMASGSQETAAPSFKVNINRAKPAVAPRVKAALVDLDVKAGFLPELVERANAEQSYFFFELAYLPFPTGAILTTIDGEPVAPQLFLPRIQDLLRDAPSALHVDRVVCLTACLIAWQDQTDALNYNYFSAPIDTNPHVLVVSATDLREYAQEAGIEFPKALLRLALGQLVVSDERWSLSYHEKTQGCLFDFCEQRRDIVVGLRSKSFHHVSCRTRIKDPELLKSIDALMAL